MLFTGKGCARLRTGLIITQIPRGYQKKSLLCRKAQYVRSLGKKTPFLAFPEAKNSVVHCARLRAGLIITQIPRGYQKKVYCVEKHNMCDP